MSAAVVAVTVMVGTLVVAHAAAASVYVFPIPGAHVASPSTQITFRGVSASSIGPVSVVGSKSGPHAGTIKADSDGKGGSFLPAQPFSPGEAVTVRTGLDVAGGQQGTFSFTIANPAGQIRGRAFNSAPRVRGDVWRFSSIPGMAAPAVRVNEHPWRSAAPGGLFVASQEGPVQSGPELLGPWGGLVWFKPVPKGDSATDFREQTYEGKPVLTWWQGVVAAAGIGYGEDEIYDSSYRPVATVKAGNGLAADLHEFQLTPQNTALITTYYPVYWNASKIKGGSSHQIVLDSVVQEIDVPTGLVLFQWDSLDHVALGDSHQPPPRVKGHPWDYFHLNSLQPLSDGTVIVSSRDTWAAYKVSLQTARVEWTLGGKRSSFKMGPGTTFAFQHDVRVRSGNEVTIFDDGAGPPAVHRQSRGLTVRLDLTHKRASLVRQDEHRGNGLLAFYEGNVQLLPNGDDFVGWGQYPYLSEFNSRGQQIFDAHFVGKTSSYRAYRFQWTGTPAAPPAAAVRVKHRRIMVWATWNGATRVARWRVVGGPATNALKPVASARRAAFESGVRLPHHYHYIAAQALDSRGKVLGVTRTMAG